MTKQVTTYTIEYETSKDNMKGKVSTMTKKERIEVMKQAGIDVDAFIAMGLPAGSKVTINLPNGDQAEIELMLKQFEDMDAIKADPYFSRWTMAQVFNILRNRMSVERALYFKYERPYRYQFTQTLDRLKELYKLPAGSERREILSRFFNDWVADKLCIEHMILAREFINGLPTHSCKGKPYKKIPGIGDVFVKDIEGVVFAPLEKAYDKMRKYLFSNPTMFIKAFEDFIKHMVKFDKKETPLNKWFIAAYQGRGAYLTATGLIEFHGCRVYPRLPGKYSWQKTKADKPLSREDSLKAVKAKVEEITNLICPPDSYMLWGMMKEIVEDNGFNFYKVMDEKYNG